MARKSTKIRFLLLYGLSLGLLLSLVAWAKYHFLIIDHAIELYMLVVAVIFVLVGVWVGLRWSAPPVTQSPVAEAAPAPVVYQPAPQSIDELGISNRELEVLTQLARGHSNDEIARQLFVSTNTVKTHLSNLYVKLDVKRRTQAIEKARTLGLIP